MATALRTVIALIGRQPHEPSLKGVLTISPTNWKSLPEMRRSQELFPSDALEHRCAAKFGTHAGFWRQPFWW